MNMRNGAEKFWYSLWSICLIALSLPVAAQVPDGYFNIDPLTCSIDPDFPDLNNFQIRLDKTLDKRDIPVFSNALVMDLDGNGTPEIITIGLGGYDANISPRSARNIEIFNGQTGAPKWTIPTPFLNYEGAMPISLADLDGDGDVEIVVATSHINPGNNAADRSKLIIYSHTGTELARSSVSYGEYTPHQNPCDDSSPQMRSGAAPGIADFNNDGRPEIYIYNEIYNDQLVKLVDGGDNGIGLGHSNPNGGSMALTVAANFNGDASLELAAGNTLYDVNITNPNGPAGNSMTPTVFTANLFGGRARDGFTSIADIDLDGEFDIVVTTERITAIGVKSNPCLTETKERYVYVWNPRTNSLIASGLLEQVEEAKLGTIGDPFPQGGTGVAFIGDVNSDGKPNIGVTSPLNVEMFEYNGSTTLNRLWRLPTSDKSGMTMITMFDFNQDGVQELVYRDETDLRIINGNAATPNTLTSIQVESATSMEGPTIADVDGDGEAEILVVNSNYNQGDPYDPDDTFKLGVYFDLTGKIEVFKSVDLPWAPARGIWNQYAYHNINIQDNRQVPRNMPKPSDLDFDEPCNDDVAFKRPLNNFLVQSTFFDSNGCPTVNIGAMDATIEILSAKYTCEPGEVEVEYQVTNQSPDAVIPFDMEIAFFQATGDPDNPTLDFKQKTTLGEEVARSSESSVKTFTITGLPIDPYPNTINIAALANNDGDPDFDPIPECDYTNNMWVQEVTPQPVFVILNDQGDICSYETIVLQPENQVDESVETAIAWFKIGSGGNRVLVPVNGQLDGATYSNSGAPDYNLTISDLPAGSHTFEIELACTGKTSRVTFEVLPSPAPVFSSDPVLCFGGNDGRIFVSSGHQSSFEYTLEEKGETNRSGEFVGLAKGDYTVRIKDTANPNACEATLPVTVEEPDSPVTAVLVSTLDETCEASNGEAVIEVAGGTGSYSLQSLTRDGTAVGSPTVVIAGSGTQFTFQDLDNGNYVATLVDENLCAVNQDFPINSTPIPSYQVAPIEPICEGPTGLAVLRPVEVIPSPSPITVTWYTTETGGSPISSGTADGITYQYDPVSGILEVSGLSYADSPYTYYMEVSGADMCDPSERKSIDVVIQKPPTLLVQASTDVLCFGEATGSVTLGVEEGALSGFEFQMDGGDFQPGPTFSNLAAGTYEFGVRNLSTGCVAYLDHTISEPAEIVLSELDLVNSSCDLDNGMYSFSLSGGTLGSGSDYEISLDGQAANSLGNGFAINQDGSFTFSQLNPGDHEITVQDDNGCKEPFTFTIDADPVPGFSTEDVVICENEEQATLSPVFVELAGSSPIFTWAYEDPSNPGSYLDISNNDQINGATHTLVGNDLQIAGLSNAGSPYTYYLKVAGELVCPADPIPATVTVLKLPEAEFESIPVSCFGDSDGSIRLISSDPSANMTYTLMETGESNATGNFSGLPFGNYSITAQEDGAPCSSTFNVEILQPEELLLDNEDQVNPTCGADNGAISFEITGGTTAYEVSINGNLISSFEYIQTGNVFEVKNLAPGLYSIYAVDANGCVLDVPNLFELVNDPGFDVSIEPIGEEICEGLDVTLTPGFQQAPPVNPELKWFKDSGLTQPINSSSSPDGDGYTYQVSNGALTISGLPEGTYSYYLEISGSGICPIIETAEVIVYSKLGASFEVINETCFEASDGIITVTGIGGNGSYEFSFEGNEFSDINTWSDLAPGTYTVSVRNGLGCTYSEEVEITGPSQELSVNEPSLIRSSCDLDNGMITDLVISGGTPTYSVTWRKGTETGELVPGDENGAINLAPDTYFLSVTDAGGCTAVFSFEIEESSDPVYDIVPPIDECGGNSVRIRPIHIAPDPGLPPAAATEVKWFKSPGQANEISSGSDGSIPGVTYTIDDSDWVNPELIIDGLPEGEYTYYFYVVCTGQEIPVEIAVFDTPEVVFEASPETCFGDQNGKITLVSGDNPEYTYQVGSEPAGTLAELESRTFGSGTYTITVATPAGCAQVLTLEVAGAEASLDLSPLSTVNTGCGASNGKIEATITGGWAPYQVEIIRDGTSFSSQTVDGPTLKIDGLTIGDYSLVVTDREGCQVLSETVTLIDGPTQVLIDDLAICSNETAVLVPSIDPVVSGVTYQWFYDINATTPVPLDGNPDAYGIAFKQNSNGTLEITGLTANGSPYYFYSTVSGEGICPGFIGDAKVNVYDAPTATYSVEPELCFGELGEISITASGGSGTYMYSLNGASPVSDPVFKVAPGTYEVEVITPESCNVLLEGIEVLGPGAPIEVVNMQVDHPTCELENGIISFELQGGYENYVIETFKNGTSFGTETLATPGVFTLTDLGIGTYTFGISDGSGCVYIWDSPVEMVIMPTVITAEDQLICEGENAILTPSVPSNINDPLFTWYFDANTSQEITSGSQGGLDFQFNSIGELTVSGLTSSASPVTYYVLAEGADICGVEPKAVTVTISSIPNLKVSNPSIVCDPEGTVDLTQFIEGFNPNVYDYDVKSPSGVVLRLDELETVDQSGDYLVSSSMKGSSCWNSPQRIRVLIAENLLLANFEYAIDLGGGDTLINGEIQIKEPVQFHDLTEGEAIIWNWDFGDGTVSSEQNPSHVYESKGTYMVTLSTIDSLGCQSEFQKVVTVFDDYNVMIPNAFTPRGQKNQYFKPYHRGIASMDFYIFNNWGELIYHTTSLEDLGWDGNLNGNPVPNGNYVYRATFVTRSGEKLDRSGVFVLIR